MSRALAVLGVSTTVIYLLGLAWLFEGRVQEIVAMSPSNIGDFLTGVFGPLAVLWLILGFFQQGIELRQNTSALKLQAEELRNTVEQQRQLVAVTRSQVDAERAAADFERKRHLDAALPRFFLPYTGSTTSDGRTKHRVMFTNRGATATRIRLEFKPPLRREPEIEFPLFVTGETRELELPFAAGHPKLGDELVITFTDAMGNAGTARYSVEIREDGSLEITPQWQSLKNDD